MKVPIFYFSQFCSDFSYLPPDQIRYILCRLTFPHAAAVQISWGSAPTVFNAANELAVKKFLEEKIGFLDIYEIIAQSMERHKKIAHPDLDEILSVEQDTYQWIESRW